MDTTIFHCLEDALAECQRRANLWTSIYNPRSPWGARRIPSEDGHELYRINLYPWPERVPDGVELRLPQEIPDS